MIDVNKNQVLLTPYKWSYEERRLFKDKGRTFFEKNYSKWATIEVDKFEDIEIIGKDGEDHIVKFHGDTHYIDAQDTYYEYWWGDKSLKKKFKAIQTMYHLGKMGSGEVTLLLDDLFIPSDMIINKPE